MEGKGLPPPYDEGYGNVGYGQQSSQPLPTAPIQPVVHSTTTSVVVTGGASGGCPVCRNKNWTGTYSCCAWLCCIFCFPCGIICCLCMRKKKCTQCGFTLS